MGGEASGRETVFVVASMKAEVGERAARKKGERAVSMGVCT